jgi:hypothetical protein
MKSLSWINFVLGLWLIIAPFALHYNTEFVATWNNVIIGIIVAVLSIVRALEHTNAQAMREQRHGAQ